MRRLIIPAAAAVFLAACSSTPAYSPTQPTAVKSSTSLAVREGASAAKSEPISVSRSVVVFSGLSGGSQTFVATTKGAGDILSSASAGCNVTPGSAQAVNDPGNGHSVTFTVSVPGGLSPGCTVTVTDKKGNTATIDVRREYSGSDLL